METLNILFTSVQFLRSRGGLAHHIYRLAKATAELGHNVKVLTTEHLNTDDVYRLRKKDNLNVYLIPNQLGQNALNEIVRGTLIANVVDQFRGVDFIHASQLAAFGCLSKKISPLITKFHGVVSGYASANMYALLDFKYAHLLWWYSLASLSKNILSFPLQMALERKIARGSDHLIAISKHVAESLQMQYGIDRSKINVIYNGVDILSEEKSEHDNEFDILYVGGLGISKGLPYLLIALSFCLRYLPCVSIRIVGYSGASDLNRRQTLFLVKKLGLENNVRYEGYVTGDRLSQLYNKALICVFPSLYEPLGNVVLEAMAHGKPVIVTSRGGSAELISNGQTGFIVDPISVEVTSERIKQLLLSPELRKKMGTCAREYVAKTFSWRKTAEETIEVGRKLIY